MPVATRNRKKPMAHQELKEATITKPQSFQMTKNLLRISLFQIAFIRNLFPSSYFSERTMFDDLNVKVLNPKCEVSTRLVEWMEKGVCEALYKEYLKCLRFGITSDDKGKELIEEYVFTFAYQPDGEIRLQILNSIKKSPVNALTNGSISQLKGQVSKMTRLLIALMASFDPIPGEKHISLHLEYYERTPKSYEPPYFEAAPHLPKFECKPFSMGLGACQTRDICIGMKAKTVAVSDLEQEISPSGNNILVSEVPRSETHLEPYSPLPEDDLSSFDTVFNHEEFPRSQPEEALASVRELVQEQQNAAQWTRSKLANSGNHEEIASDFFHALSLDRGNGNGKRNNTGRKFTDTLTSTDREMKGKMHQQQNDCAASNETQDPDNDLAWDFIPASQPQENLRRKKLSRGILSMGAGPSKRIRMQESQ